jgi:endonuclease YncB( thermonuclease family)
MEDVIWGDVIRIIDGDTFDIKVTHYSRNNRLRYNNFERIRIAEINAPELRCIAGQRAKEHLERVLNSKYIRCEIQSRDVYHRLVCKVTVVTRPRI